MAQNSSSLLEKLGFSYFGKLSEYSETTIRSLAKTFVQGEAFEFSIEEDGTASENKWDLDFTIAVDDEGDVWAIRNNNQKHVLLLCKTLYAAGFTEDYVLSLTPVMVEKLALDPRSKTL